MALVLELVARTSVLVLAAAVLARVMTRASSASRHLLWTGVLTAAIVLPLARTALPAWPVAILPPATIVPAVALPSTTVPSTFQPAPDALAVAPVAVADLAPPPPRPPSAAPATVTAMEVAIALWAIVCAGFVCRMLVSLAGVWRLRARSITATDSLLDRVERARAQFHVRRSIATLMSPDEPMPMTWGVVRPTILLPASISTPAGSLALGPVIVHEVAHIARLDAIALFVARLAVALHWFNPLVWFAARQARLERERACDDAVLASGTVASDYAMHLLTFVRPASEPAGLPGALAMARRTQLEARVQSILDGRATRGGCSRASVCLTAALMAAALPIAVVRVTARAADRETPAIAAVPGQTELPVLDPTPSTTVERTTLRSLSTPRVTAKTLLNAQLTTSAPNQLTAPTQAVQTTAACTTPDPFVTLGGGRCVNGGWLPQGVMPLPAASYVIGVDDLLVVTVWRAPEVSGEVRVKPDGTIRLPMGNDIRAAGQTTEQLKANIGAELARFYTQPDVFVQVKQINSRMVFVPAAGNASNAVQGLAEYAGRRDEQLKMLEQVINIAEYLRRDMLTKIEIGTAVPIATAGPERTLSDLQRVTATLRNSQAPSEAEMVSIRSRYIAALRNIERQVVRFDNGMSTWQTMHEVLMSAAATVVGPTSLTDAGVVWITGEVNQPGKYPITGSLTISQLITLAGGFLATADREQVVIVSATLKDRDGQPLLRTVNYRDIEMGKNLAQNLVQLSPGDVVMVRPVR